MAIGNSWNTVESRIFSPDTNFSRPASSFIGACVFRWLRSQSSSAFAVEFLRFTSGPTFSIAGTSSCSIELCTLVFVGPISWVVLVSLYPAADSNVVSRVDHAIVSLGSSYSPEDLAGKSSSTLNLSSHVLPVAGASFAKGENVATKIPFSSLVCSTKKYPSLRAAARYVNRHAPSSSCARHLSGPASSPESVELTPPSVIGSKSTQRSGGLKPGRRGELKAGSCVIATKSPSR
mmetsp:Transcript_62851/g.141919  ORF Transcript_62851/g.141919 Transcript_62851/m.141919 type:complete len:234 (+) Transcript_62851:349-1050(+)